MDAFFFWLFSAGMIVCGLAVILNRNPVASALCFAFSIVFMSALFVMLNAFFLAAVQILVTAGAVMVLFLFIIMLLDITVEEHRPRQKIWMACSLVLGLGFVYLVARVLKTIHGGYLTIDDSRGIHPQHTLDLMRTKGQVDDIHQIGHLLFGPYVAPFEVTSLLILVATIGVIVLCKEEPPRASPGEQIDREAPPLKPPAA
jgi:NADH-quinone oxidoreductase subunit J